MSEGGYKIALIGEAWGAEEAIAKRGFIGSSGQELTRMLNDAGIDRGHCYITNVFNIHPPGNNIEHFLVPKKESSPLIPGALVPSKYLSPAYRDEILRLYAELEELRPNIAILLGNTACWALLHDTKISKIRGAVTYSKVLPWLKCLPTYHPAAVLRQYDLRHVTVLDFVKARVESEFPEVRRVEREIWLDPSLSDIAKFYELYLKDASMIAFDIETNMSTQITCIGFAPSKDKALVIPIYDYRKPTGSYWNSLEEELAAWDWVQKILDTPAIKLAQNGKFDMYHIWASYGITVRNAGEDTMLLHHALHPESPKSLDFLGSVYTNEMAWKTLRIKGMKSSKREDSVV